MEAHTQTCQECGCRKMQNVLVRQPGQSQVVLARCTDCGQLVARYELKGYYHHGKGFEAWLRHVAISTESSIDLTEAFTLLRERAPKELQAALRTLASRGDEPE